MLRPPADACTGPQSGETLLCDVLETVPDALIVIDRHGTINSFSAAATRLFGYRAEELADQNANILWPSAGGNQRDTYVQRYLTIGEQYHAGIGRCSDGSTFPMELIFGTKPLPTRQLYVAYVRDLTERNEREYQLRLARNAAQRASRAKSHFLAGMSHEMRTPLNGLLGYARLLQMEGGLSSVQNSRVANMLTAGAHLLEMITCVLDLTEIEAEHVEVRSVECEVLPIADACLELVRPAAELKNLQLAVAVDPGTPKTLITDPMRLRQMLLNLLGNAVKYTTAGAVELRLRHLPDGSALRIEVTDTGPGIPDDQRDRLFHDFDRLGAVGSPVEGAGLGLALSIRLARLVGGQLGHDHNPGGGSVFWLELPLDLAVASLAAAAPASSGAKPGPAIRALRVLVVDDVAMNHDIAAAFLRMAGHDVTCVESGDEAIAEAASTDLDIVLMDVRMPGMDGLEATRRIRALEGPRGRVPIVAMTAQAFTEQVAECRKAGMNSHLSKPFDPETLLAAVARATAANLGGGRGETVLVVEDNVAMRRAVVAQLALLGYRILEAENAKAALAILETQELDLVFSDIVMPGGMDGFELADRVSDQWPGVRIVLTSGYSGGSEDGSRHGLRPSIRLLSKPYGREKLAQTIRDALDVAAMPARSPTIGRSGLSAPSVRFSADPPDRRSGYIVPDRQ